MAPNTLTSNSRRTAASGRNFERAGRENAGIADEKVEAGIAKSIGHTASPSLDALLVGDVADAQRYSPAGCLLRSAISAPAIAVPKTR